MDYQDENDKLEQIFNYLIQLSLADADYSIKMFTRMIKGIFVKESILDGNINKNTAFLKLNISPESKSIQNEYNNVDLPEQKDGPVDILKGINTHYLPSISSILKIESENALKLEVQECSDEQLNLADEYNCKLAPTKDIMFTHSVYSEGAKVDRSKGNQSIGFAMENAKGKVVQSLGNENVKVIEGITKMKNKHIQSNAFKDKKQLKKDLENWFDDDDEEEKLP